MEPPTITATALGAATFITTVLWLVTRHGRSRARRNEAALRTELVRGKQSIASLRLGEREAAWAASATSHRLDRMGAAFDKATHEVTRLQADLNGLRRRLAASNESNSRLEATHEADVKRLADIDMELDDLRHRLADTAGLEERVTGTEQRLAAVVRERDRLRANAERSEQLESELASLGTIHRDLAAARAEADELRSRLSDVTARPDADAMEAELERLEIELDERDRRIAAAEAVGAASLLDDPATYAQWDTSQRMRLSAAVTAATARLETEVEHLREVVAEKERMLRSGRRSAPDPVSLPITTIRGIGPAIARILADHEITTIADVARLSEADIDRLATEMPVYPGRIRGDDWVGQARALLG